MTEVVSSSSQQASRPLTRSSAAAMATRSSAAAPAAASAGAGTALARHPQQQHHGSGGGGSGPGVPPSANHNNNAGSAGGGPAAPAHSSTSTSSSHAGHGHQRQTHHHGHGHGHHPPPPPIQTSHAHPTSARGPMTRKRAASIVTEDHHQLHNHPRIEDLSLSTPTTATTNNTAPTPGSGSRLPPDTTRDLICLCTPAPKVPRPRNAFILYRQHHQAQVVAQHPGLANPEISKIIGEQWRDEPEERKNQWKRLAEEEKQRHQRQYPDYRYQPRRGNKGVLPRLTTATGEDPGRCPKCGGRYIATPRTPLTPFVSPPASANKASSASGLHSSHSHAPRGGFETSDQNYRFRHPSIAHHQMALHGGDDGNRGGGDRTHWSSTSSMGGHTTQPLYDIQEGGYDAMSPSDAKRRRYQSSGPHRSYQALPSPPTPYGSHSLGQQQYPHHVMPMGGPAGAPPTPGYGPQSAGPLPGPSMIAHGGPGHGHNMAPPPRPGSLSSTSAPHQQATRGSISAHGEFDESLRLPPLQTHMPTSPNSDTGGGGGTGLAAYRTVPPQAGTTGSYYQQGTQQQRDSDARRHLEAMVMSIPYMNKLQVLERISPPLPQPAWMMSPSVEPPAGSRGPIIAVEGPEPRLLQLVAPIVQKALLTSGECDVRVWSPSSSDEGFPRPGEDITMADAAPRQQHGSSASSRSGSVGSTFVPTATGTGTSGNIFGPYLQTIMEWHVRAGEIVKYVTSVPAPASSSSSDAAGGAVASTSNTATDSRHALSQPTHPNAVGSGPSSQQKPRLPVALLPAGYCLTLSDRFACSMPIVDEYATVDHWQWMATLWRGIAGPDLTVYVRAASEEELTRLQPVEFKSQAVMVVRVSEREVLMGGGVLAEKTERRLGFEVVEWVRSSPFFAPYLR